MSLPDILRGTYVNLMLGNGASPEVFDPICGLITRTFTHQGNTADAFTRDCALPESIPVRRVIVTSEQWDLTGSGQLNRAQMAEIQAAVNVPRNWRLVFGEPTDDEVFAGYYAGQAILTQLKHSGDDNAFVTVDLTIMSDGPFAWVDT